LEAVLDTAPAEYGVDVLEALLADVRQAPPNKNHNFFANHIRQGGRRVTANFDTCITG